MQSRRAQYDAAVSADGAVVNESWNSVWDVATSRSGTGWTLEMRIPLSSLRFQVINNQVTMGVLVTRFITESNEWSTFPAVDPHFPNADAHPSLGQAIVLDGVRPTRPVYVRTRWYSLSRTTADTTVTTVRFVVSRECCTKVASGYHGLSVGRAKLSPARLAPRQ